MATVVTLPIISSSANLLAAVNSSQPIFQPLPVNDELFFDEGPRVMNTRKPTQTDITTSLGNLSSSYPWTQGVEMNKQAMYDAGLAKIWSGEPGHQLKPAVFGQDKNFFPDPGFADMDLFSPLRFLQAQENDSPLWYNIITFPIITGDNDQLENFNFNGIIEAFPIRPVVAFFSTDVPFEAHQPRAFLVGGNDDILNGSDRILTVDYFDHTPGHGITAYQDQVDIINPGTEMSGTYASGSWTGGVPYSGSWVGMGAFTPIEVPTGYTLNGFFQWERSPLLPFVDQRLSRNTTPNDDYEDIFMIEALAHMSGNTDNYVRYDQVSAPCGWDYDRNSAIGTDSLVFGGMTY
jgi:hypothetical protein